MMLFVPGYAVGIRLRMVYKQEALGYLRNEQSVTVSS